MPSTNLRERSSQLLVLGLLTGPLLAAFAQRADAQWGVPPLGIQHAFAPPDLVVVVNVPAQIQYLGQAFVEIRVNNTVTPLIPGIASQSAGSAAGGVFVEVKFAGLEPLTVQGNSGFQCGLSSAAVVVCTGGAIPAAGTAVISVSVKENHNCKIYCGPVYTDALVDTGNAIAERSETNNRDLGVTDVINCPL